MLPSRHKQTQGSGGGGGAAGGRIWRNEMHVFYDVMVKSCSASSLLWFTKSLFTMRIWDLRSDVGRAGRCLCAFLGSDRKGV